VIALLFATGAVCAVYSVRRNQINLAAYLGAAPIAPRRGKRIPRLKPMIVGFLAGVMAAVSVSPRQVVGFALAGAAAGGLIQRAVGSTRRQRRAIRLHQELPTVADTLALHILAGESVSTAIGRFTTVARGVAAEEFRAVLPMASGGLEESLRQASVVTAHPEGARLYDLLGHAHRTGGRLAEALTDLAVDFRAGLARDLTAEGGRRALTTYGPILALMIPVTLLFLMYPTLAGLSALSSTP